MNEAERYKRAFSVLHASEDINMEVIMNSKRKNISVKKTAALALAAALILALCVSAYAVGEEVINYVLGWGGKAVIAINVNSDGNEVCSASLSLENSTEPVQIEEGRMYFIVNNEHLDITDDVKDGQPFTYTFVDSEGCTRHFIIGLNSAELENYGYAEFIRYSDGNWAGGYGTNTSIGDEASPWLEIGKKKLELPWS